MTGEGNQSAINPVLNFFTTSTTTEVTNVSGETISVTGAPIESEGLRLGLDNSYHPDKSTVQNYSINRSITATEAALGTAGATMATCSAIEAGTAVASVAASAVPGGTFVRFTAGMLASAAGSIALQAGLVAVTAALVPYVAQTFFTNVFESTTGLPAGELVMKGASANGAMLARQGSGATSGDKSAVLAMNRTTNEVLALDAATERATLSPFDTSSRHTFLGSIFYSLSTTTFNRNFMTPTVFADNGTNSSYLTTFGTNCSNTDQYNMSADIYCIPEATFDESTLDITPDDPTYQSVISSSVYYDADGNEIILENSGLADYIKNNVERESLPGIFDANIYNNCLSSLGLLDAAPVAGDIISMVNAVENPTCSAKATGEYYNNSSDNIYWQTEGKYYQRYVADNRYLDQMGAFEDSENPIANFTASYYDKHPLDNSSAGQLARISGMTLSDARLTLDAIQYVAYINNYNPKTTFNFQNHQGTTI